MKILEILQKILLKEQEGSDPKNPDVYPDQDEWGMDDAWTWDEWKIYYDALVKKGGEIFAKKRFLKYWEVVQEGTGVVGDDGMDPNWFKSKKMWNEINNRPYTSDEFIKSLEKKSTTPETENNSEKIVTGVSDKLVSYVAKKETFIPCVYDDKFAYPCIVQSLSKKPDWSKCCNRVTERTKRTTIGYGTTYYPDGKPVMPNDKNIDKETAKEYLKTTLNKMAKDLLKLYPNLNQQQLDAMASLCYNVGFAGCTSKAPNLSAAIKKDPNSKTNPKIKPNFLDFANADRRADEFAIYHDGNYPTA
jgi:GH24 family phage-related lysozyme (muramidase)